MVKDVIFDNIKKVIIVIEDENFNDYKGVVFKVVLCVVVGFVLGFGESSGGLMLI